MRLLLLIAAIMDIYGSRSAFDTRILFLAYTQPRFLESEILMMLSSMLITSFSSARTLMYSDAEI